MSEVKGKATGRGQGAMRQMQSEATVQVRVPVVHGEEDGAGQVVPVQVNGVYRQMLRGETVELPAPLYVALKRTERYDV